MSPPLPNTAAPLQGGDIVFFATGIEETVGGIASANRNVRAAMTQLAAATGTRLKVRILHEPRRRQGDTLAYGGAKLIMARDIVASLVTARLVVFDHVHLATPLATLEWLPKRIRSKTVVFAHGSESWKRVRPVSVRAFRAADLVLTNSTYTLEHMRMLFDGFVGRACPLGLPPQFPLTVTPPERAAHRPSLRAADGTERSLGARAMLLVGRLDAGEREKGHRELIEALPQVLSRVPEADLVFVGDGSDSKAVASLAAASPAAGHIFLTGRVNDGELTELYKSAYAFVMPSRQEGFGLVYLEAMNEALPCLACHDDGAADVVVHGKTGFLVHQPISQIELVNSIISLLSDPDRARVLGVTGWNRLKSDFTSAAHQARVFAQLKPLLSRQTSQGVGS